MPGINKTGSSQPLQKPDTDTTETPQLSKGTFNRFTATHLDKSPQPARHHQDTTSKKPLKEYDISQCTEEEITQMFEDLASFSPIPQDTPTLPSIDEEIEEETNTDDSDALGSPVLSSQSNTDSPDKQAVISDHEDEGYYSQIGETPTPTTETDGFPSLTEEEIRNNRIDKNSHNLPFTRLIMTQKDGNHKMAEMLNSLPEEVLLKQGWDEESIRSLSVNEKSAPLSERAQASLGIPKNKTGKPSKSLYFGQGAYGKVKFARITDPTTGEQQWCVAKKLKPRNPKDTQEINRMKTELQTEINHQQKAGDITPKIHGFAETLDKQGKKEFVIFMDQAQGMNGFEFMHSQQGRKLSTQQRRFIMGQLIDAVGTMHDNGICHKDLKWDNCTITSDGKIQLLDFGMADRYRNTLNGFATVPCYWPPEAVSERPADPRKMDVYSLGVMFVDLVKQDNRINPFYTTRRHDITDWSFEDKKENIEFMINEKLSGIDFPDTKTKSLITDMLNPDPQHRPSMEEVLDRKARLPFGK
ncbi:Serine/threonine-protein kinase PK-1 [invertebrate metagenome]|uniref:Serine/threonine-protein kinase PK-1 n=1 Tax=invertebrate metagenome TaxID=1711999 RepID=A0A2H9T888_9ZZZZ